MRTLDPVFLAAVTSNDYRAGYALKVTLASEWGIARYWRWTTVPGGVTIDGESYVARPLVVEGAPQYGQAALSDMSICVGDTDLTLQTEIRNDPRRLRWRAAEVFELAARPGYGLAAERIFLGAIQTPNPKDGWCWLRLSPDYPPWGDLMPDAITALCPYRTTEICSHALECSQSEAACDDLGHLDISGAFLYLIDAGTPVMFRDGGVIVGSSDRRPRRVR